MDSVGASPLRNDVLVCRLACYMILVKYGQRVVGKFCLAEAFETDVLFAVDEGRSSGNEAFCE